MSNSRLKDRQMTCGKPQSKNQVHRKKCTECYRRNSDYFKSNYLNKKLDSTTQCDTLQPKGKIILPPKSRLKSGLPLQHVQEVIDIQHLAIIEYLAQLLVRRFKEMIKTQLIVNTRQVSQLPGMAFLRCDRL